MFVLCCMLYVLPIYSRCDVYIRGDCRYLLFSIYNLCLLEPDYQI